MRPKLPKLSDAGTEGKCTERAKVASQTRPRSRQSARIAYRKASVETRMNARICTVYTTCGREVSRRLASVGEGTCFYPYRRSVNYIETGKGLYTGREGRKGRGGNVSVTRETRKANQ